MKCLPDHPFVLLDTPAPSRPGLGHLLTCVSLLAASLGLAGCGDVQHAAQLPGYIEADITSVASPAAGKLAQLSAKEGQSVKAGDKLYVLESNREQAQLAEAQARKQQAESQTLNLSKGAREAELDSLRARLRYTKAQLAQAQTSLQKTETLLKKNFVSEVQVTSDRTNVQLAQAQVEEARASLKAAKSGARTDERAAAQALTSAAEAGVQQVQWMLQQKQVSAPINGIVQEIFVRQGEFAQPGATVLTILRQDSQRVRFFVPNDLRPRFMPGANFEVLVSGCDKPLQARITRVSARPEYTQPLMFGPEIRDRLSFLTEGALDKLGGCSVPPGTPVGVLIPGAKA